MECCEGASGPGPICPGCGSRGRLVPFATLESLLTAPARERLEPADFHYCAASHCGVVYFSARGSFELAELHVPVFHKQAAGERIVCYCLGIREDDADFEATAASRVRAYVQAGSCACEMTNPEGRCCLGNLHAVSLAATPPSHEV